jgi:hypothetical protein
MARHVAGDLGQVLNAPPCADDADRLPPAEFARLRRLLAADGYWLDGADEGAQRLAALRQLYEPYVAALAGRLALTLPPWIPAPDAADDWQTTAWQHDPRDVARVIASAAGGERGAPAPPDPNA